MYYNNPPIRSSRARENYENFATADRPRCLMRDDYYPNSSDYQQQPRPRYYRKFDYLRDDDFGDERAWHWNMSHQKPLRYNGSSAVSSSSSKSKRNADRSSGFQSFFRWFKKDDKNRNSKDIRYPRELTDSTDTLEYDDDQFRSPQVQFRKKLRGFHRESPSTSSPRFSYGYSQSSSCDSIFSTASSFAFVPPIKYLLNRNQRQTDKIIIDNPYTETYHKRVRARDRMREIDRTNEVTLRKKYHLYAESSDTEANNNSSYTPNHNRPSTSRNNKIYQDLSLPNSSFAKRDSNVTDSVKLEDLNVVTRQHRRASSDSSKDRKAGSFVHVKNKKKAPPPPPLNLTKQTPKTLSGRRRKRQAPAPPISPSDRLLEEAKSATSLLGDKEIQALIQGTSLVKNSATLSSPIVSTGVESPIMEKKKIYISPYLKIREDRKLTDEQKRILLEQVTKSHRKSEERLTPTNNVNTLTKDDFPMADNSKLMKEDRDKVFSPSSPISPRPWYKRSSNNNSKETVPFRKEIALKTLDKKKKKNEKDLPEVGYSRNSFFDTASKFNIFAKMGEDSKKKDADKRKSLIGIPNISELDREAAEIMAAQKLNANDSNLNDSPSAKDLIQKFEANSSQVNRINSVGDISGREEFFGKNKFSFDACDIKELSGKPPSSPPVQPRNSLNGIRNSPTAKIKMQMNRNSENIELNGVKNSPNLNIENLTETNNSNFEVQNLELEKSEFDSKSSKLESKAFNNSPKNEVNGFKNSPMVKPKIESSYKNPPGDGLLGLWKCPHCTLENPNWKIICEGCGKIKPYEKRFLVNGDAKRESPLSHKKFDKSEGLAWERKSEIVKKYFQPQIPKPMDLSKSSSESFIPKKSPSPTRRVTGSPKMFPRKLSIEKSVTKIGAIDEEENSVIIKTTKTIFINDNEKKTTPDLNEVRNARLARFHTSFDIKRNQTEVEIQNAISTNRKQSPEKKILEKLDFSDPAALEKEKERLRDKIRAMNAKALAEKYPIKNETQNPQNVQPSAPSEKPANFQDATKLGAIKKVPKKPLEIVESSEEEKIINKDVRNPQKLEKISISVQTAPEPPPRKKSEDFSLLPISVIEITKDVKPDVIEETKLAKTAYNANTMAINKILRNLENSIADGRHDEAAKFAKDLAKLKVPLSVMRQKDRPKSDINLELSKIKTWLCIKEDYREMEVNCYEISPQMTIDELKQQIAKDYYVPVPKQRLSVNGKDYENGTAIIRDLEFSKSDDIRIYVNVSAKKVKTESESDDEVQNEKVGGAVGGVKIDIEDKGWECSLCTLINLPERNECLACSTLKPKNIKDPQKLKEIEYHLKVKDDLRTFFDMDKVDLRIKEAGRNDLDRQSGFRKSSDIFNILVEDKEVIQTLNPIVMTAALPSPNITRNKYRGVENFNPYNKSYLFPKKNANNDLRKPIITNVIYKSNQNSSTKDNQTQRRSHYQELVNLDISDAVPNSQKFECTICFMDIEAKVGVCLRDCLHTFCKPCLESHIKYSDDAEVKCPFINEIYSCQSILQEREIRGLVTKEEYEKHLSRSIQQAENKIDNAFHCKTPNCKGWCIFEDDTNSFRCPVCTIVNCITCGAIHDGLNCKEYQDHLAMDTDVDSIMQTKKLLQDLIEKNEAMNCPTCHIFLLKKWGCDWLKCSFCKTEICWVTKQSRWGPGGKGDTSAGCKCGLNGKKCSPKCTYCH